MSVQCPFENFADDETRIPLFTLFYRVVTDSL